MKQGTKSKKDYDKHAIVCKRYEKTRKGLLMRTYRNMKSRVLGIQYKKAHLYKGLELLDKNEFYLWSFNNKEYNDLFDAWTKASNDKKLTPSIDRVDTTKGYIKENMRWVTHSENSRLGALSQWNQKRSA